MADIWKEKMHLLASEKETTREQLASTEVQLRVEKEKAKAWFQIIEDLQAQLGSTVVEWAALGKDLESE